MDIRALAARARLLPHRAGLPRVMSLLSVFVGIVAVGAWASQTRVMHAPGLTWGLPIAGVLGAAVVMTAPIAWLRPRRGLQVHLGLLVLLALTTLLWSPYLRQMVLAVHLGDMTLVEAALPLLLMPLVTVTALLAGFSLMRLSRPTQAPTADERAG